MRNRWQTYKDTGKENENFVNHDHQYQQKQLQTDISQEGIDVYEEEINYSLPKSVIPIDKYRLVVELGHIIKQLR